VPLGEQGVGFDDGVVEIIIDNHSIIGHVTIPTHQYYCLGNP
jgi:hypothetical protein